MAVIFKKMSIDEIVRKVNDVNIVFIDTETNGLSPLYNKIIEIGAVRFCNYQEVDNFSSLVNSNCYISPRITFVNHITNQMIQNAPLKDIVYNNFIEYINSDDELIFCAHNARFDISFLEKELNEYGYHKEIYYVDTIDLAKCSVVNIPNYKLSTLLNYFDIVNEEEHRALGDARACAKLFYKLVDIYQAD